MTTRLEEVVNSERSNRSDGSDYSEDPGSDLEEEEEYKGPARSSGARKSSAHQQKYSRSPKNKGNGDRTRKRTSPVRDLYSTDMGKKEVVQSTSSAISPSNATEY